MCNGNRTWLLITSYNYTINHKFFDTVLTNQPKYHLISFQKKINNKYEWNLCKNKFYYFPYFISFIHAGKFMSMSYESMRTPVLYKTFLNLTLPKIAI